jgi:hypothetical protein
MTDVDLLIFGSGSLTRAVVMALAGCAMPGTSIMLAGRNESVVASMAMLARARAAALDRKLSARCIRCDYSRADLRRVFGAVRPKIVLVLASHQSPWAMSKRWRELVQVVGYGFTLPFQVTIADTVFRAALEQHPGAHLLNGCYPDMANGLLVQRGLPVSGGIGNVAIIASLLRSRHPGRRVRVLAHHSHVVALIRGRWEGLRPPVIWVDDDQIPGEDPASLTEGVALPADDALNAVTGAAAVPMLDALAGRGESWEGHAPGVDGHPGGYPVRVDTNGMRISLPEDMTLAEAKTLNEAFGQFDGVVVDNGVYRCVRSSDEIERATGIHVPEALLAWRPDALEEQMHRVESLRHALDPSSERALPGHGGASCSTRTRRYREG